MEIVRKFLGVMELWRDTQRESKTAFLELVAGLDLYSSSRRNLDERLLEYGVETSFMDSRRRQTQEKAAGLLRAESELCRLNDALKVLQHCCEAMEGLRSLIAELQDSESLYRRVSECTSMYRTEFQVGKTTIWGFSK